MTQVEAVPVRKVSPLLYKTPIVPPVIGRNVPRPPADLVERFRSVFLPDISDKVGQLYTMDSGIRPLYQPIRCVARLTPRGMAGPVRRTVSGRCRRCKDRLLARPSSKGLPTASNARLARHSGTRQESRPKWTRWSHSSRRL
jgi:hypothetical protein